MNFKSFIILFFLPAIVISQGFSENQDFGTLSQISSASAQGMLNLTAQAGLNASIDEQEYLVDSGDLFIIKIDVKGPAIKIFQSAVTPDGYLLLPGTSSVKVKYDNLKLARDKIIKKLHSSNPSADIEVYLFQLHPITVDVIGSVLIEGKQQLTSSSRLFDAVLFALQGPDPLKLEQIRNMQQVDDRYNSTQLDKLPMVIDSSLIQPEKKITLRRVELIRRDTLMNFDLLKFKLLGDLDYNPYLMNNDIIKISTRILYKNSIEISGAVANPIDFEYLAADKLSDALAFAGGLIPSADSSNIEVFRFTDHKNSIEKINLDFSKNQNFQLKPDDRIMVRHKTNYHKKEAIEIIGEIKFPGIYPIEQNRMTLSKAIELAGGITEEADLSSSIVLRQKITKDEKEYDRLLTVRPVEMDQNERSYFRLRSREDLRVLNADFVKLITLNDFTYDVILKNKDIIHIPKTIDVVYLSGGVKTPGNYDYHSDWEISDYVRAAGGYVHRARKGSVKVIKYKTGNWLGVKDDVIVERGDIIFIPVKPDRDVWSFVREGIAVTAQIGAIVAVIVALYR